MAIVSKKSMHFMCHKPYAQHVIGRALVHLKNRQNVDERIAKTSKYHNDRGFCKMDAKRGTEDANFYEKYGYLTLEQIIYWKTYDKRGTMRIAKYHAQLAEEAWKKKQAA
jgi:hypothetical protein